MWACIRVRNVHEVLICWRIVSHRCMIGSMDCTVADIACVVCRLSVKDDKPCCNRTSSTNDLIDDSSFPLFNDGYLTNHHSMRQILIIELVSDAL